jgi:hypothetical protein
MRGLHELRHGVFAHNRRVVNALESADIEPALHLAARACHLLDAVIPDTPLFSRMRKFSDVNGDLKKLFSKPDLEVLGRAWDEYGGRIKSWGETPIRY